MFLQGISSKLISILLATSKHKLIISKKSGIMTFLVQILLLFLLKNNPPSCSELINSSEHCLTLNFWLFKVMIR